jgi:hypothetical protein
MNFQKKIDGFDAEVADYEKAIVETRQTIERCYQRLDDLTLSLAGARRARQEFALVQFEMSAGNKPAVEGQEGEVENKMPGATAALPAQR